MSKVDELMALADEWADECAGCDGSHLAEQSTRRKTLRNALQAALVQSELWQPIETAPRDGRCMLLFYKNRINKTRRVVGSWYTDEAAAQADVDDVGLEAGWYERIDNWDEYPQAAIHEGEPTHWMPLPAEPGAAPPPTHAHDSEPAAYVLMSSYLIDGKAEVSLAFEKPESEGYASVIPLYVSQSVHTHKSAPEQTPPPRLAGGDWRHARLEDGDDVVLRALAKAYRFAVTGVGRNVGQYRGLIEAAIQQAQTQTATQVVVPLRLTDDQIMGIAQSLGWWTVDKEIAADALRLSCAIEATVRKQFGVNDEA